MTILDTNDKAAMRLLEEARKQCPLIADKNEKLAEKNEKELKVNKA